MANNKIIYIVIAVLIIGGGIFFFLNNKGEQEGAGGSQQTDGTEEEMVSCGEADSPMCFVNRMNGCLPVTTKLTGADNTTSIEITILGVENEKCHFQRKLNNVLDMDCYFPKGTLNTDTLDQMFGNDKGLQQVVDDACQSPGW